MTEAQTSGDNPKFDITKAGPLTLHEHGISFAVDGMGQVLRNPDGTPIPGERIEESVSRSGGRLTNAQAAGHLVASQEFADRVTDRLAELSATEPEAQ